MDLSRLLVRTAEKRLLELMLRRDMKVLARIVNISNLH